MYITSYRKAQIAIRMEKLELEFGLKTSSKVLYQMLSTPSGLSRWFANDVNINRDGTYSFIWDGSEEVADKSAYFEQME